VTPSITVVGAGVIGLSSALVAAEAGLSVRVISERLPADSTSAVAAAIWYPYLASPPQRMLGWARRSLDVFRQLAQVPESGVHFREVYEYFDHSVSDPWWWEAAPRYRRLGPDQLRPGYRDGWAIEVPVVEMGTYLAYLVARLASIGVGIEVGKVSSLEGLGPRVLNCSGIGARELADDPEVFPIRGQVVRVQNPGITRGEMDEEGPLGLTYVIPRSKDVVLGGTAQINDWRTEVDAADTEAILARAAHLVPELRQARVESVGVGLRPGRSTVRLEIEIRGGVTIVHNYGHGGAGVTLSWGCAEEAVGLIHPNWSQNLQ